MAVRSLLKKHWSNGSLLIGSGSLILLTSGSIIFKIDQNEVTHHELRSEMKGTSFVASISQRHTPKLGDMIIPQNIVSNSPILYQATVTKALGSIFDGPAALKNLTVGQKVGVIIENVGPEGRYHLSRSFDGDKAIMEGWYPKDCLQKCENIDSC